MAHILEPLTLGINKFGKRRSQNPRSQNDVRRQVFHAIRRVSRSQHGEFHCRSQSKTTYTTDVSDPQANLNF